MTKKLIPIIIFIAVFALALAELQAQRGPGKERNRGPRNYNPATVETIKGIVAEINTVGAGGIHITVKTKKETISIHLGPVWYLENKISIASGDLITAVGSRVIQRGKDVIIAKSIRKGKITVILRDDSGIPQWAGKGRRAH